MIFDEGTLRRLNALSLVANKVRTGALPGDRRSHKKGNSIEFADYRDYVPGDDLRRLDWRVYARLERPYIKLFEDEQDLSVHILIDSSASMDWGEAETNKFDYGRRVAAGLATIGLATGDNVTITMLKQPGGAQEASSLGASYGPVRGQAHQLRVLNFLELQPSGGHTVLDHAMRSYAHRRTRPGLAFVVSDLFAPDGFEEGLSHLRARGHEVAVLHTLHPEELDPPLAGDVRLVDIETGDRQSVSLDGGLRNIYRERVEGWQQEIRAYCRNRDMHYIDIDTSEPWDKLVLYRLRREGLVR
jgi:uncharacterized protein (DUF58 family)